MNRLFIVVFISILIFSSCEDEIDFKGSITTQKLVVNCLLASDSAILVNVFHSSPIQANTGGKNPVSNAIVKLYENSQFVGQLKLSSVEQDSIIAVGGLGLNAYTLEGFKASSSKRYKIEVEADGYETVFSEVFIPQPVSILKVDTTYSLMQNSKDNYKKIAINFVITFKDPPDEKNYYRVVMREKNGWSTGYGPDYEKGYWVHFIDIGRLMIKHIESNDISINPQGNNNDERLGFVPNNLMVFNDDLFDGKEHTISVYPLSYRSPLYDVFEFNEVHIELHSISEDYYLYAKSLGQYNFSKNDEFAEPVLVHNNIKNGLGVFGAYSISKQIILYGVFPADSVTYTYVDKDSPYYR